MQIASLVAPLAVVAFAAVFAPACSGAAKDCTSFGDCGSGETCSFPADQGCNAKSGKCVSWSGACDQPAEPACACTGKTVFVACGFPGSPVPLSGKGYCPTATGGACVTSADCDPTALCAFPIAGGCDARGVCVAPDNTCLDTSHRVACSCAGSVIGLACAFGAGNAVAPVRSLGACTSDAGASDASNDARSDDAASDAPVD